MTTNNAINLRSAGIVSYDGAGNFTALANPLTVPNGGLGVGSFTAYGTIIAGTTSTGPCQSLGTPGPDNTVLLSKGAGFAPYYAPIGKVYSFYLNGAITNLADSTTYYLGAGVAIDNATRADRRVYLPVSCNVLACYGSYNILGTIGSSEAVTISLSKNFTTDETITSTQTFNASSGVISNTNMSTSFSAGDFFGIKIVTPVFATNPSTFRLSFIVILG